MSDLAAVYFWFCDIFDRQLRGLILARFQLRCGLFCVHTKQVMRKKSASLRRFSRLLREGFLDFEGVLQWFLEGGRVRRRVLRRGSTKGVSKRHLEGRNTPFREHDPLPVCPIFGPPGAERPQDETLLTTENMAYNWPGGPLQDLVMKFSMTFRQFCEPWEFRAENFAEVFLH